MARSALLVLALAMAACGPAQAQSPFDDARTRVAQFFQALDAVDAAPSAAFLRLDELGGVKRDKVERIDLYELRRTGDAAVETRPVALGARLLRLSVTAGTCRATRYIVRAPADGIANLPALRADPQLSLQALPAGDAPAFPRAMRTCSADVCHHRITTEDAPERLDALFAVDATVPRAGIGEPDPEKAATTDEYADFAALSVEPTAFCQQGILVDPR